MGFVKGVEFFLDKGVSVDAGEEGTLTTALMDAAGRSGQLEVVRLLVEKGADVTARDYAGYTALVLASIWGHEDEPAIILERSADATARCMQSLVVR
jgi:ankyrin repeat protein